jgi:catechol 2,3-dioxygenase-like lactoylglutathione lyase family enzyme
MNLNHLSLLVRDVDRSVVFYRDLFGFDGPSEWQGETFVIRNAEGFSLALTPDPESRRGRDPSDAPLGSAATR